MPARWLVLLALTPSLARADPPEGETPLSEEEQAAKQSENPISATAHFVVENSASYLIAAQKRTLDVATVTLILPVDAAPHWTVIPSARFPLVWAPDLAAPTGGSFGLGDLQVIPLLAPKLHSDFFVGVGFAARVPTATSRTLGAFDSGQLSVGPAVTVAFTPRHFVVGANVNQVWSVAGRDGARDVSTLAVQPLLNYNLPQAWYLTSSPYILSDWTAPTDRWLVPVGGGIGKLALLPPRAALAFEVHAYWNVIRPDGGPVWNLRLQLTLSFPK